MKINIVEHYPNSHSVEFEGKKLPILLVSDVHFDSRDCNRELLKKHFDEIKKQNGLIFCFGDWFDVMGCHKDPRSKGQDVRPEYLKQDKAYLDLIIQDSFEFLKDYPIAFMSYGNHETAIIKHRDTDILNTLIFLLRNSGKQVYKGGYSGYISFKCKSHEQ